MPLRQWQTRFGRRPESSVVPLSAASLTDVDFGYVASRPILSRLNLRIPAGKLTMVLGRNGAGKSTLIGVLAGVLRPQRGEVALREVPLRTMRRREIAQQVAVLWQARHSPPGLHVLGLVAKGAQAVILGCTEISLLVNAADAAVPLFDTTRIHATTAAEYALADRQSFP